MLGARGEQYFIELMNSSEFLNNDSRLRQLIRGYSGQLKDKSANNPNLEFSSHPSAQYYNQSEMFLNNDHKNNSDVRSLIENLMKTKDMRLPVQLGHMSSKPALVRAEQKIFSEVVSLLIEINEIKQNIDKEKETTLQLESERDHILSKNTTKSKPTRQPGDIEMDSIINRLKSREGDDYRISMTQLDKIAAENEHLEMKINRMKIQSEGNAKQVLEQEKERYRTLRAQLDERKAELEYEANSEHDSQDLLSEIKRMERDIDRLKSQTHSQPNFEYEIRQLNEENNRLRQKVVRILQANERHSQDEAERWRLEEEIRRDEESKLLFLEDLKKYKAEYQELQRENERLRRQLKKEPVVLIEEGRPHWKDERLYQYHDLMSEMQSVMK